MIELVPVVGIPAKNVLSTRFYSSVFYFLIFKEMFSLYKILETKVFSMFSNLVKAAKI